jgi:hypothetical protein
VEAFICGAGKLEDGTAVERMTVMISLALQVGCAAWRRAATPAASGAEALVPIA